MILLKDTANHVAFLPRSSEASWMPACRRRTGRQTLLLYQLFSRPASLRLFSLVCLSYPAMCYKGSPRSLPFQPQRGLREDL